ncbi:MAG TPA: hypothetical protein VEL70_08200 [Candidatus Acidoferrum sp.]|nr:hypothetical protein [Candidatus Acidoferrum sp.]
MILIISFNTGYAVNKIEAMKVSNNLKLTNCFNGKNVDKTAFSRNTIIKEKFGAVKVALVSRFRSPGIYLIFFE